MRVPLSWLKEYVDVTLPVTELADKLTVAGLEVEQIEYIGLPGGNDPERLVWDRDKVVVGQIIEVQRHPAADRLVLATVEYGHPETEVVVTGAPNLFAYVGQGDLRPLHLYSPFALEEATLYDGHQSGRVKMTLKGRQLRGIYNRCMLCSEKELGLSEDHEGILLLDGRPTPGTPIQDVLGDVVLDIAIIPNVARCASVVGVAREVAALTGQKLHPPSYEVIQDGPPIDGKVVISTENPDLNPRFVAMLIAGVEQKPSPRWLQRRLQLAGQRPINVVVDVSNYVMLEMGQPNHTFDYDVLRGRADQYDPDGPIHIITRLPQPGEKLTTLDGIARALHPFNILVTDPAGCLSLGGVMGGQDSEINPQTTNVLLEAAGWNFINIRQSATAHKLMSEAAFRFSRGVHPSQALLGAKRAAELLRQLAGGTVAQGIVDYYPSPPESYPIVLTAAEVERIGGLRLSAAEIQRILTALEFQVEGQNDHLLVTAPDHRLDITGPHDLVEEVCRIYGYENIPATEMSDVLPPQRSNVDLEREEAIKDSLVKLGLQEIITYRLTTPEYERRLLPAATGVGPDDRPYVTLTNPITVERVAMRHSLLASLLEIAASNSRFHSTSHLALFEIGPVYLAAEGSDLPDELRRLAILLSGPRGRRHWRDPADPQPSDFYDLKGVVEGLLADLHLNDAHFEAANHPTFRPGRTARLLLGEQQVGYLGELHPQVVEACDVQAAGPVLAADLDLELILPRIPDSHLVEPASPFPAVMEDLALVVDKRVPAAEVTAALRQAGRPLLTAVELFDVFEGGRLAANQKSLAYHLTFQSPTKTLTDKEVSKARQRILQQLERQLVATLRQ